jgi:hypothetical protein
MTEELPMLTRQGILRFQDGAAFLSPVFVSPDYGKAELEELKIDCTCKSSACKLAKNSFKCVCHCKHSPAHGSRVREHNHLLDEYQGGEKRNSPNPSILRLWA